VIRNRLLSDGTLCPDHVDSLSSQYDTHSMYGWFQAQATREYEKFLIDLLLSLQLN